MSLLGMQPRRLLLCDTTMWQHDVCDTLFNHHQMETLGLLYVKQHRNNAHNSWNLDIGGKVLPPSILRNAAFPHRFRGPRHLEGSSRKCEKI